VRRGSKEGRGRKARWWKEGTKMRIIDSQKDGEAVAAARTADTMERARGAKHEKMVGGYYAGKRKHEQA